MANIKISELNELETKHDNDLLAIVDSANNETKKIKVENLVSDNVELKLISDTQPTGLTHGDKYYNTTTNKIYVYVGGGEYIDLGEPKEGILYILFDTQESYAYNGTTLISLGGSSDYSILGNKPSINNVELNGNKSLNDLGIPRALNTQTTSTTDGYCCTYINTALNNIPNQNLKFEFGRINSFDYVADVFASKSFTTQNTYTNAMILVSMNIDAYGHNNVFAYSGGVSGQSASLYITSTMPRWNSSSAELTNGDLNVDYFIIGV